MKLETAKSFILVVLIGISLLLTYGLWSYQPEYAPLKESAVENDAVLGGIEESKKGVIEPTSIIFHSDDNHYGFTDPMGAKALYSDMQSWVLYNFETKQSEGIDWQNDGVEVIFPDDLPMSILQSLFDFNETDMEFPSWSFNRIYFTFVPENSSLTLQILSANGNQQATAVINDASNYEQLWSYISNIGTNELREYTLFNENNSPIYIPADKTTLGIRRVTINDIDPNLLVNALFTSPSAVRPIYNDGDRLYTDSQRQIRVYENGSSMEYYYPYSEEDDSFQPETKSLIDRSIKNINDHLGWTEEYNLQQVEGDTVRFQMFFEGLPVYDNSNLNLHLIEQRWKNQELSLYQRSLFTLENSFSDGSRELPSGRDIVYYLENNQNADYNMENIEDVQIGYRLDFHEDESITLVPTWYMNYNGNWIELIFEELTHFKGGS
ncbi:hypothetical protein CIL05_16125 [Virgibacillus profundi]|uniref:Regulatory protein YycH domain-containing protein n=1 Tax=Virgibacillus profundi TaxID=2024555 RepID=A0A2A2IB00_9BACI|nr:two-component system activity regulator YycH [Virgibacillus profundi]PAV28464.1 hypothetical protein CIL05_16125 [Virgibacillus profundi]PXY52637.1 hypothetical protein CIT14_16270 [Virgibacillus profundi]